jgi:Protein of unknown function (DUF3179)
VYARRLKKGTGPVTLGVPSPFSAVNDEILDFDHRGWLYEESFVFYDFKTDSLWVQATGEAVHGPLKGSRLERLPATQSTWERWRKSHPGTRVLSRPRAITDRYWVDSYTGYYESGRGVRYQRHAPLGFGLALLLPGEQKLYPFQELDETPVLADRVDGQPVVIVYHKESGTAVAFDRKQQGRELDFILSAVDRDDVQLTDRQTQSTWSGLTGQCLKGASKGAQLRQMTTTQFVVENWPLHYPKGAVYSNDE